MENVQEGFPQQVSKNFIHKMCDKEAKLAVECYGKIIPKDILVKHDSMSHEREIAY